MCEQFNGPWHQRTWHQPFIDDAEGRTVAWVHGGPLTPAMRAIVQVPELVKMIETLADGHVPASVMRAAAQDLLDRIYPKVPA